MMGHTTNSESDKRAAQPEQLCWEDTIVYVKKVDIDNKNIQSFIEKETYEQLSNEEKSKYSYMTKREFNNKKRNNLMWVHKITGKTFDREAYDDYPDKDKLRETTVRRFEDSQTKYVHIENFGKKRKTYLNQDKYDALDPSEKLQYIPTSSREQNIKKYRENMQKKKVEQAKNSNNNNNNASPKTKKRRAVSLIGNRSTLFQSDEQRRTDDNDDADTRHEIEDIGQSAFSLYAILTSRTPAPHERIMLSFLEGLSNVEPRSGQELSNNNNNNANNNSAVNQSNQASNNSGTRMISSLLNNHDEEKSSYRA